MKRRKLILEVNKKDHVIGNANNAEDDTDSDVKSTSDNSCGKDVTKL